MSIHAIVAHVDHSCITNSGDGLPIGRREDYVEANRRNAYLRVCGLRPSSF